MSSNKKTYEGTIIFSSPKTPSWLLKKNQEDNGVCWEFKIEKLIFDEGNKRVKFDYHADGELYTVDISEKNNGYWEGKYSYWDEGNRIEERLNECELFKKVNGSYLICGRWNESRLGYYFCVEFNES